MGIIVQGLGGVALVTQGYALTPQPGRLTLSATVVGGGVTITTEA